MATVLKSNSSTCHQLESAPVAFNLQDLRHRAIEELSDARRSARELIQAAETDASSIRARARQEGLQQAESELAERVSAEARRLSEQSCHSAISCCEATLERLYAETASWLSTWRDQTVSLAAKMAEKIVRKETNQGRREVLQTWLEETLRTTADTRQIRVCVHPDDYAIADQLLKHIAGAIPQASSAEVVADDSVELAGCVIRTSHGQIDLQIATQLERLVSQLS